MRILFVGIPTSIHVVRWSSALTGLGWDLHLFPAFFGKPKIEPQAHPMLTGLTYWDPSGRSRPRPERDVVVRSPLSLIEKGSRRTGGRPEQAAMLARLIRRLRPDIVHSMEFQHAGYLTHDAYRLLGERERPVWIASNYGSDIALFGQFPEHVARIRDLLATADVCHCECARDVLLARELGFTGTVGPLIPVGGGWDLEAAAIYREPGPTSARRTIALKAAEGWAGRAGVALEALRGCGDVLDGYTVELFLASREFLARAAQLSRDTGLRLQPVAGKIGNVAHQEILALHGRSRISIGLSISDGISTSLLEAMIMGSFPIQSCTACADEWIEDGVTGILVPPEDPEPVAAAIRRALSDDDLVDTAAAINAQVAREDLEFNLLRDKMITMYQHAATLRHPGRPQR